MLWQPEATDVFRWNADAPPFIPCGAPPGLVPERAAGEADEVRSHMLSGPITTRPEDMRAQVVAAVRAAVRGGAGNADQAACNAVESLADECGLIGELDFERLYAFARRAAAKLLAPVKTSPPTWGSGSHS